MTICLYFTQDERSRMQLLSKPVTALVRQCCYSSLVIAHQDYEAIQRPLVVLEEDTTRAKRNRHLSLSEALTSTVDKFGRLGSA